MISLKRRRVLSLFGAGTLALCLLSVDNTSRGESTRVAAVDAPGGPRLAAADLQPNVTAFTHPGILVTQGQLDFVKGQIAAGAEPWTSALARAKADPHGSRTYVSHPPHASAATNFAPATDEGIVLCGSFSDPDVHCTHEKDDGVAAYTQALL
ncbi:MAG TPA: hypothetical protein VNO21_03510, partial [Polyangiaceae bacterium]|nr:hypothetical protein [Polyangiaceae bacterium]